MPLVFLEVGDCSRDLTRVRRPPPPNLRTRNVLVPRINVTSFHPCPGNTTQTASVDESTREFFAELTEAGTYHVRVTTLSTAGDCEPRESSADGGFTFYLGVSPWTFGFPESNARQAPIWPSMSFYMTGLACRLFKTKHKSIESESFLSAKSCQNTHEICLRSYRRPEYRKNTQLG